jgi:hypothetical protein
MHGPTCIFWANPNTSLACSFHYHNAAGHPRAEAMSLVEEYYPARIGLYPIATFEKQLLNLIGNLL